MAVDLAWVAVQLTGGVVLPLAPLAAGLGSLVVLWGLLGAIAVAVFRYQLYDIDRLLNRTLVYGLVTVILGTGYAALVLVLGQLLGGDRSSLGVAGATLVAAALFHPLRRRVQQAVDRRFDRRRYDAARTIEGSVPACAKRSTWTCSPASCCGSSTRQWSRPRCGCGCDHGLVLRPSVRCALADHQLAAAHPVVDTRVGAWAARWCCRPRTAPSGGPPQGPPVPR